MPHVRTPIDWDRDGYLSDTDCDDNNPQVNPGQLETLNGLDDDCNGLVDDSTYFVELGPSWNEPFNINNNLQVVGLEHLPNYRAFVWALPDGIADLGTLGGMAFRAATDINDAGQIVGSADTTSGLRHAFLITPEDTDGDGTSDLWNRDSNADGINDLMIDLGTLGGGFSFAKAINEHGQVAGNSTAVLGNGAFIITPEDTDGDGRPDVWNRDLNADGVNDLMFNFGEFVVEDVNDAGLVVGLFNSNASLWTRDGGTLDLGRLGGGSCYARGVNNNGQVVGTCATKMFLITPIDADGDGELETWNQDLDADGANDLMVDLGTLSTENPYEGTRYAYSVNDKGQVVGYIDYAGPPFARAFIINPEDTDGDGSPDRWYRDNDDDGANDLMEELSTPVEDERHEAYDVNDHGQVVGIRETVPILWTGSPPPSTPVGTDVTVMPVDSESGTSPVTVTFDEVTDDGFTRLTITEYSAPLSRFRIGTTPIYYDLTTTATYSGSILVCIDYTGAGYSQSSEQSLTLYHFEDNWWTEVSVSLDTTNNIICGEVSSLSPFAIFEPFTVEDCGERIESVRDYIDSVEISGKNSEKTRDGLKKKLDDALAKLDQEKFQDAVDKLRDCLVKVDKLANAAKPTISQLDAHRLTAELESAITCVETLF